MFNKSILNCSFMAILLSSTILYAQQDFSIIDLGTLGGNSEAHGVNDHGHMVCYSKVEESLGVWLKHVFLYKNGQMMDIHNFDKFKSTEAVDINNSGIIVGNGETSFDNVFMARGVQTLETNFSIIMYRFD